MWTLIKHVGVVALVLVVGTIGGFIAAELTGFLIVLMFTSSASHVSYTSPGGVFLVALGGCAISTFGLAAFVRVATLLVPNGWFTWLPAFAAGWIASFAPWLMLGVGTGVVALGVQLIYGVVLVYVGLIAFPLAYGAVVLLKRRT